MFRTGRWLNTGALIIFQVLGLFIPLLTLPWLSAALGLGGFGQLMYAQALVFLAVLWVDSGFNLQSQRLAALNPVAERSHPQALLDNLQARLRAVWGPLCLLALLPLALQDLSYAVLLGSLPLLLGTFLFPQWWLLATGHGLLMGLATVVGRLLSAVLVWALVRKPEDLIWATLAISAGSMLSGFFVAKLWLWPLWRARHDLSTSSWRPYRQLIQPTLLPTFLANACAQVPTVVLGSMAGPLQTGLFSAADRLTRSGAHLFSVLDQSVLTQWLQPLASKVSALAQMRRRILIWICLSLTWALGLAGFCAPWLMAFLYGPGFMSAVDVFRILLLWLWLQSLRRLLVSMHWVLPGLMVLQARMQWLEVLLYAVFAVGLGAAVSLAAEQPWGLWAATGLCGIEALLLLSWKLAQLRAVKGWSGRDGDLEARI